MDFDIFSVGNLRFICQLFGNVHLLGSAADAAIYPR